MKPVTLKGERIVLRPLRMSDAKTLVPLVNDKELSEYLSFTPPLSLKDEKDYVKRTIKGWKIGNELDWAITLGGELIGTIALKHVDKKDLNAELGIWVARKHHRKGVGYESAKLVINFAFKKLGLNRIYYYLFTPNVASKKLIEKLGGKFEGMQRETTRKDGVFYDSYTYGILRKEWGK